MRFLGFEFNFGRLLPAATTVYCKICKEPLPSASSFNTTAQCKHSFCRSCLSWYIAMSIDDGIAKLPCPDEQCQAMLDPLHCKELVSSKSFLSWCDLLCESYTLGLVRCYCPNLNCHEVIVNECGPNGDVKRFECPRCHQSGCFHCAAAWNEGHQCRSTPDVELSLLEHLANTKMWMQCPNCHMYVERDGGCSYIFCRCQMMFCHDCGQQCNLRPCPCTEIPDICEILIPLALNILLAIALLLRFLAPIWTEISTLKFL